MTLFTHATFVFASRSARSISPRDSSPPGGAGRRFAGVVSSAKVVVAQDLEGCLPNEVLPGAPPTGAQWPFNLER